MPRGRSRDYQWCTSELRWLVFLDAFVSLWVSTMRETTHPVRLFHLIAFFVGRYRIVGCG